MSMKCDINKSVKVKPIRDFYKSINGDVTQCIGIAIDEPERLSRKRISDVPKISLLEKYGYTEQMAFDLCKKYDLLSPVYEFAPRGGCWFCPNCKIQHFVNLRRNHPELWAELVELSHTPNLCSYGFKYGLTVQEVEKRMNAEEQQLKLF